MPMLKYGSYSLRNIYIYSICHPQADIEALTMQEQNLDEQIKLVTKLFKNSCYCYYFSFAKHASPMFLAVTCGTG